MELFTDDKRLVRGLRAAERKLKAFGANIRNMGLKMAGLGTAVLAPMLAAAKAFSSTGDQVAKMADAAMRIVGLVVLLLAALGYGAIEASVDKADKSDHKPAEKAGE